MTLLWAAWVSVMVKKKDRIYDTHWIDDYHLLSERRRMDICLTFNALKYVEKLGEAVWISPTAVCLGGDRFGVDWADAELQAKLIHGRLKEIKGDTSLDAQRERAFLQYHARRVLLAYSNAGDSPHPPALPADLLNILDQEYPGREGVIKLRAFEEDKPLHKEVACGLVSEHPDISQGELTRLLGVPVSTIRLWTPTLMAWGWEGTELKRKAAAKSKQPVEPKSPKRGTPSMPTYKCMEGEEPEED